MAREDADQIRCYRCGELKAHDEFAWRRKERNQRDSFCRPCRAEYKREHYRANRQRYIDNAARIKRLLRLERTKLLLEYFADHPCADCGEADPLVLDFDHLRDKRFNVAGSLLDRPWSVLQEEMAKCEVVCANCHRRRTAIRNPTMRLLLTMEAGGGN